MRGGGRGKRAWQEQEARVRLARGRTSLSCSVCSSVGASLASTREPMRPFMSEISDRCARHEDLIDSRSWAPRCFCVAFHTCHAASRTTGEPEAGEAGEARD